MTDVLTHLAAANLGVGVYWAVMLGSAVGWRFFPSLIMVFLWPVVMNHSLHFAHWESNDHEA